MTSSDRVDFVAGQVHGLQAVIAVLIHVSPNPEAFQKELAKATLSATAMIEATTASEEFFDGFLDVTARYSSKPKTSG